VVDLIADPRKCTMPLVLSVERNARSHLNQVGIDQFTAETASRNTENPGSVNC
jgi:hypothetical protein